MLRVSWHKDYEAIRFIPTRIVNLFMEIKLKKCTIRDRQRIPRLNTLEMSKVWADPCDRTRWHDIWFTVWFNNAVATIGWVVMMQQPSAQWLQRDTIRSMMISTGAGSWLGKPRNKKLLLSTMVLNSYEVALLSVVQWITWQFKIVDFDWYKRRGLPASTNRKWYRFYMKWRCHVALAITLACYVCSSLKVLIVLNWLF